MGMVLCLVAVRMQLRGAEGRPLPAQTALQTYSAEDNRPSWLAVNRSPNKHIQLNPRWSSVGVLCGFADGL